LKPSFRPARDRVTASQETGSCTHEPLEPEDVIGAKARPFTGAEYLASLGEGREVYIYGDCFERW